MTTKEDPKGSERAATETSNVSRTGTSEEAGEQTGDELERLLAEHDEPVKPEPKSDGPDDTADLAKIRKEVADLRRERDDEATTRAVAEQIAAIKQEQEALNRLPDHLIEGLLEAEARKDRRVAVAFGNRDRDPAAWNRIRSALGARLADTIGRDEPVSLADAEAARQSVRGTSTSPPPEAALNNAELSKLSDAEFNRRAAEVLAKAKRA